MLLQGKAFHLKEIMRKRVEENAYSLVRIDGKKLVCIVRNNHRGKLDFSNHRWEIKTKDNSQSASKKKDNKF